MPPAESREPPAGEFESRIHRLAESVCEIVPDEEPKTGQIPGFVPRVRTREDDSLLAEPSHRPLVAKLGLAAALSLGGAAFAVNAGLNLEWPLYTVLACWLLAMLPFLYVLRLRSIARAFSLVFLGFVVAVAFDGAEMVDVVDRMPFVPALVLATALCFFALGGTHYFFDRLAPVARVFRVAALYSASVALLMLSTNHFAAQSQSATHWRSAHVSNQLLAVFLSLVGAAALITVLNMKLERKVKRITKGEGPVSLVLLAVVTCYGLVRLPADIYVWFFTCVLAVLQLTALTVGLKRADARIVNLASTMICGLLLVRFHDMYWGKLPIVTFCLAAVALVGVAGFILAKLRRRFFVALPGDAA